MERKMRNNSNDFFSEPDHFSNNALRALTLTLTYPGQEERVSRLIRIALKFHPGSNEAYFSTLTTDINLLMSNVFPKIDEHTEQVGDEAAQDTVIAKKKKQLFDWMCKRLDVKETKDSLREGTNKDEASKDASKKSYAKFSMINTCIESAVIAYNRVPAAKTGSDTGEKVRKKRVYLPCIKFKLKIKHQHTAHVEYTVSRSIF
jgi:hypothetical protein